MASVTSSPVVDSSRPILASGETGEKKPVVLNTSSAQEENCCVNISKKIIVIAVGIILTLGLIALAVCAALFAFPLEAVIVPAVGAGIVAILTGVYAYVTRSDSSDASLEDADVDATDLTRSTSGAVPSLNGASKV